MARRPKMKKLTGRGSMADCLRIVAMPGPARLGRRGARDIRPGLEPA